MSRNERNSKVSFDIPEPKPHEGKTTLGGKIILGTMALVVCFAVFKTFTDPQYEQRKEAFLWLFSVCAVLFGFAGIVELIRKNKTAKKAAKGVGGLIVLGFVGMIVIWFLGALAAAPAWAIALFILWFILK